jgi:hypothetical protein
LIQNLRNGTLCEQSAERCAALLVALVGRLSDGLTSSASRLAGDLGAPRWSRFCARACAAQALADKARTIRIPVHIVEKLKKIGRAERKLTAVLGRAPTGEEIAEVTGIEPEEVESIKRTALSAARARAARDS